MITRDELAQKAATNLLNLANDLFKILTETGLNPYDLPEYTRLNKYRKTLARYNKKYPADIGIDCGERLREFCIPFELLPIEMFDFMVMIDWIDGDTCLPRNRQGFYSNTYHGSGQHRHDTVIEWYIDVKQYIELLFIYDRLKSKFAGKAA